MPEELILKIKIPVEIEFWQFSKTRNKMTKTEMKGK